MGIILITQKNCEKCDYVKARVPKNLKVGFLDARSVEGMATLAFHQLMDAHTPILIIDDKEVVTGAIDIVKKLKSLPL